MKITLRKANALQLLILEKIKSQQLSLNLSIDKYTPIQPALQDARNAFAVGLLTLTGLLDVLYSIRKAVAKAGQEAGIASILTDLACLTKAEELYKNIDPKTKMFPGEELISQQQSDLKTDTSAYRKESFAVGILEPEILDELLKTKSDIRKKRVKLSDELLELNIKTEIELNETQVSILQVLDII